MFYLIMNIFLNWQFSKYLFCPDTNQFFVGFIFLVFPGLDSCEKITIHEIYEPIILFIVLAFLQSQIVSPLKYKNLDFFEQHPVISTSSGGEPKIFPRERPLQLNKEEFLSPEKIAPKQELQQVAEKQPQ